MSLVISSSAFRDSEAIPARYTCEGDDLSPPLEWSGVPTGTKSLALIMDDPDAPMRTWVHWVLCDIPRDTIALADGVGGHDLPPGTVEGLNDWKRAGYGGPCPPVGRHRYFFKLFALDVVFAGLAAPTKAQIDRAMKGHILARAELVGTYEKQK